LCHRGTYVAERVGQCFDLPSTGAGITKERHFCSVMDEFVVEVEDQRAA